MNKKGRESLKKKIRKEEGYILSDGTLDYQALLCKAYDLINDFGIRTGLKKEIAESIGFDLTGIGLSAFGAYYHNQLTYTKGDLAYLWSEDVFNLFSSISPIGYYFGSLDGDGACIGWFKITE